MLPLLLLRLSVAVLVVPATVLGHRRGDDPDGFGPGGQSRSAAIIRGAGDRVGDGLAPGGQHRSGPIANGAGPRAGSIGPGTGKRSGT